MKTLQAKTVLFIFILLLLSLFSCKTQKFIQSNEGNDIRRPLFGEIEIKLDGVELLPDSIYIDCKDSIKISSLQIPYFGDGMSEFDKVLSQNFRYPEIALDYGLYGRTVASFIVGREDCVMKEIKIERTNYRELDMEVLRVLNSYADQKWHWLQAEEKENEAVKFFMSFRFTLIW